MRAEIVVDDLATAIDEREMSTLRRVLGSVTLPA
jgi:hypothetical protein